ncbi:hypothetical protein [Candidatus Pelagibacter sp.]|uniref:hypothetical protein n=1 Tax=Candidatus Pelagibacter sp. TaxID=2024849 RepID=UPI003F8388A1
MKLRTFYKIYYEHRYKKANHILKFYILIIIPIKYFINLIYLPKIINLDDFVDRFGLNETTDLSKLFDFFNSDKGSQFENQYAHPSKRTPKKIKGHGYGDFYQKYFENLKSKNLNILEIGSFHGNASAALFFYFKNSKIFAADIYPDLFRYKSKRIESFYVNSADENSIQKNIIDKFSNNFDIIIEDAGHFFKDQIISLFMLFKKLNSGGFFIIEELDFPDTRRDMNLKNEKPTLREILLKFQNEKILLNSKYIKKNDRDNFLNNIDSIEIYKGNFNEIAILKKK